MTLSGAPSQRSLFPRLVAYIDGGSRGNPGPAGYGVRFEDEAGGVVCELHQSLGTATNNVAEYSGLLAALSWAAENGFPEIVVKSDSELLVKQMRGEYKVRHPGLQPLYQRARDLVSQLRKVSFQHVPRHENTKADRLANLAMDEAVG
jgi:ribonuclease HI